MASNYTSLALLKTATRYTATSLLALTVTAYTAASLQMWPFTNDRSHVLRVAETDLAKDLGGRIYLVTGANSGVGLETTRQLVKQGAHVVMACRRPAVADEVAAAELQGLKGTYETLACDLCDLASVKAAAATFVDTHKRLDGLVCNAGLVNLGDPKKLTKDGLETTIGVSYFGHFQLTELLLDMLKKNATPNGARMVILSSVVMAGSKGNRPDIDLDDLAWQTREPFQNMASYNQAKVACCLYALELADRLKGTGVTTASVHPGWARSSLGDSGPWYFQVFMFLARPFIYHMTDSNEESAQTTLHCLLNDDVPKHSGAFFSQHSYLYSDKECKAGGWPLKSPNPNAVDLDKAKEMVKRTRVIIGMNN